MSYSLQIGSGDQMDVSGLEGLVIPLLAPLLGDNPPLPLRGAPGKKPGGYQKKWLLQDDGLFTHFS
jgi:hypothetical protein